MAGGEQAFAHALCKKACLQLIYAQAVRRWSSSSQKAAASPSKAGRQTRAPTPPNSVYVVEKVTDALADVVSSFIQQIARSSLSYANHSQRSHCNFLDVLAALDSLSSATQSTTRDIARYATYQKIEFPMPVPEFPVLPSTLPKKRSPEAEIDIPTDDPLTKRPRTYIEPWMPPIPSAHTFVSTPGYLAPSKRSISASGTEQKHSVEVSLAQLRDAGGTVDASSQSHSQLATSGTLVAGNPFTRMPLISSSNGSIPVTSNSFRHDEERQPLEPEENLVDSNTPGVTIVKSNISDQKRARVDRILAESGTIMVSATASTPTPAADGAAAPSTPGGDAPAPSPKGGAL